MYTRKFKSQIDTLCSKFEQEKKRTVKRIRSLVLTAYCTTLQHIIDTFLTGPTIEEILEKRICLLERSYSKHLEECALPEDCEIVRDYESRIEELEWLLERLNENSTEISLPFEGN